MLGLAAALAVAEGAVRLVRPQPVMVVSPGLYAADPPRRYRLRPGFHGTLTNRVEFTNRITIDGAGLRGPELAAPRPGTLRLLALGDSFTFGVGVEQAEAWPARLAARLSDQGIPAEARNAGAPGFGVPDEVAWLSRWGLELSPNLVLVAIFVGNDLQDASPNLPRVEVADGELVLAGQRRASLGRWLYYHSHLFVLLKTGLPPGLDRGLRSLAGRPEPWEVRALRLELDLYRQPLSPPLAAGAAATDRALADLAGLACSRGLPVAGVLIPSEPQADPAAWSRLLGRLGESPAGNGLDPRRPTRLFLDLFGHHGIPTLDLTPALAAAIARGEPVYYPVDKHLTPRGQDLAAGEIARFLAARGLV